METVTAPPVTRPAYASVEYYAAHLRRRAYRGDVRLFGLEFITSLAGDDGIDDTRAMQDVRNVVAAVELVRAECVR